MARGRRGDDRRDFLSKGYTSLLRLKGLVIVSKADTSHDFVAIFGAERQASGTANGRSEARAEAMGGRLKAHVRLGTFHWAGEWDSLCFGRLFPLAFLRSC
jgi:hypothetical protein